MTQEFMQGERVSRDIRFPCYCEICGVVLETERDADVVTITHASHGTRKGFCCLRDCEPNGANVEGGDYL